MSLLSIAGATPSDEGFELKSLRINDDDSAYLQKVYPTSGNRLTWTFSCWSKVTEIGVGPQTLFCGVGESCLLYTSPSPRDGLLSRMPSSA